VASNAQQARLRVTHHESLKVNLARNIITGIDAGTSAIKVVIAEQKKGENGLHILGVGKKISRGIRRGYAANFDEAAESIKEAVKEAEKMAGFSIKRAYVAAGGISLGSARSKGTVMISRADGEITEYDIKRVLSQSEANLSNSSNKRVIHNFPSGFKIDGNIIDGRPEGMKGAKLETDTLFITCLNQHLFDLIKAVEATGVAVDDVIASPLAASFSALTNQQKEVGCVLANIGSGTVSIIVFEDGLPISLEVFPIGSTHITNDIALGMQIPLDEAEKMKINYGSDTVISKRKLSDIIEARLNDIFELIESHLKKINRDGLLPAGIILTGGGSSLVSLEDIAKSSLRLPAKIGTPFQAQNHNETTLSSSETSVSVTGNSKDQVLGNPEWSVALGLCMIGFSEEKRGIKGLSGKNKIIFNAGNTLKRWFRSFLP